MQNTPRIKSLQKALFTIFPSQGFSLPMAMPGAKPLPRGTHRHQSLFGMVFAILCWLLVVSPLMGQTGDLVIDSFQYTTPTAAQAAWTPRYAGQPVLPTTVEGVSCLTMPVEFTTSTVRSTWDKVVNLDLSAYTHLSIRINGSNTNEAFGMLSIYLKTGGGGWWSYDILYPSDKWQTYVLPFADFKADVTGTCTGWADIRQIRISPWQHGPGTGSFEFADMRAKASASANLLLNGGFEITTTEDLPDCWGSGHWSLYHEPWVLDTDNWRSCWGVDRTVSHSGSNSLRISSSGDVNQLQAYSTWMNVKAGQAYTLSAWLKSNQSALPVNITFSSPGLYKSQTVTVDGTWRRFSVSGTSASDGTQAYALIYPAGSGTVWIDDVQLEKGLTASTFQPSALDETINSQAVHRVAATVGDYPYTPGGSNVTVGIDPNRRFLVDGQPFIPIALGWQCDSTIPKPSLAILQEIARAGFNTLCMSLSANTPAGPETSASIRIVLDNARTCGLKVLFWTDCTVTTAMLGDWVTSLKDHSAIIAWYVYDEPTTTAEWKEATDKYNIAKTNDPSRPAYVNSCYNQLSTNWVGDILSTDYYPVPYHNPVGVSYIADDLEQIAAPVGKPVWMWGQNIGYAFSKGREPTGAEAEVMTYLSMIHGARGFLYCIWKSRSAEHWAELRELTRELRTLTPVLSSTDTAPVVSADSPSIHLLSKICGENRYVIAVNESSLPVTANMISAEVTSASATVLFENRNVNVVNGGITDTFAGYQRHVYSYSSDLAGHWKLDETSGTVALDSSCNDHDGTVVDATWTTAGKIDGALSFTGSTSYVVADGVEVNTVPGGFNTIAFWMKWNGVNNQMPFGWNQAYGYDLWIADGSFGINTGQGNILGIPSAGMAGQWVHVAAVFPNGVPSASNAKIYINGVNQILTDRSYPTTTNRSATSKLFISGWGASAGYKFGGTIDDVRVYNRALTAEEVAAIAAAP